MLRIRYSVEFPEVDQVIRVASKDSFPLSSICAPGGSGAGHCMFRTLTFTGVFGLEVVPGGGGRQIRIGLVGSSAEPPQGGQRTTMGLGTPFVLGIAEGPVVGVLQPFTPLDATLDMPAGRRAEIQIQPGLVLRLDRIGGPPDTTPPSSRGVSGSEGRTNLPALPPLGNLPPLPGGFRELGPVPRPLSTPPPRNR